MTSGQSRRDLRIGDAEREAAIETLGRHLSSGHLDINEYSERSGIAAAARTGGELDDLFTDLPGPHQGQPPMAPGAPPPPPPGMHPPPAVRAPYGVDVYGRPCSSRNRWVAGVLQLVFPFGVGRFYTGNPSIAIAQLFLSPILVGVVWCYIDGIIVLAQGGTDGEGRQLRG